MSAIVTGPRRNVLEILLAAMLVSPGPALAAQTPSVSNVSAAAHLDVPAWLFPSPAVAPAAPLDSVTPLHLPGSRRTFTAAQLHDAFAAPDWYPDSHRAMPRVVSHGRKAALRSCAYCHLPDGAGRPENAMLAGLPAAYIVRQLADLKSGARQSAWRESFVPNAAMRAVADSATDAEVREAARYFAHTPARRRIRVIERDSIPHPQPSLGLYVRGATAGNEALGNRIIEIVDDAERHEMRDARVGYAAYVPNGSIARGRVIATSGRKTGGKTCASCHGTQLRGIGLVPPIAGRTPGYLVRQLLAFRNGTRAAAAGGPMRQVVATLTFDDMIALAAYVASRAP